MITADKLRAWLDVLEAVEHPVNLQDTAARATIDAIDPVIDEMRDEYVRAVRHEAEVA